MKIEGYVREGYKQTIGNRISFADAVINDKETIYFEILAEDKKESVIVVMNTYADAMRLAMDLMNFCENKILGRGHKNG